MSVFLPNLRNVFLTEMLDIEGRPQMMDNPPVLENDSNEATFLIHPSVGEFEMMHSFS
jgi:hypothetical protein